MNNWVKRMKAPLAAGFVAVMVATSAGAADKAEKKRSS